MALYFRQPKHGRNVFTLLCTNTKLTTSNPQISVGLMMMDSDPEQIIWVSYACIKDDVMGKGEVIV